MAALVLVPAFLAWHDRPGIEKASPNALSGLLARLEPPPPAREALEPLLASQQAGDRPAAASSAALFSRLFSASAPAERLVLAAARERFARAYPDSSAGRHHAAPERSELVSRLGLLKSLGQGKPSAAKNALFRSVAVNHGEHWLVRRQALRNLRPSLALLGEPERLELLAASDPRALALASLSEQELLLGFQVELRERRAPAAASGIGGALAWEELPCPSAEAFEALSARIRWAATGAYECDLSAQGKLGRLFAFLDALDFGAPAEGAGPIAKDLRRPFEFLERSVSRLGVDLRQETTIAYNMVQYRAVMLGSAFFELPPIEAMQVLIHEARHSYPPAHSHALCVQGDIPNSPGGCDTHLSDGADAGAYSYGVYFYIEISRLPSLSAATRELAASEALSVITRRFNRLPPRLAQFTDGFVAAGADGKARFLHPFARAAFPLEEGPGADTTQVSFAYATGGALLFPKEGGLRSWGWGKKGIEEVHPALLRGTKPSFVGKLTLPNDSSGYTYTAFAEEARLRYVHIAVEDGQRKVSEFPLQTRGWTPRMFVNVSAPLMQAQPFSYNYFLSAAGELFRGYYWGGDQEFNPVAWASEGSWRWLDAGVLHDTLFAIGREGRLLRQQWSEDAPRPGDEVAGFTARAEPSSFQAGEPVVAYQEGTQARALLTESGRLELAYYADPTPRPVLALEGTKITSFAMVRLLTTHAAYGVDRQATNLARFAEKCGVPAPERDPWLGLGIGLNGAGLLLVEGKSGECLPAALPAGAQGKIRSFRFSALAFEAPEDELVAFGRPTTRPFYFAPSVLELELADGRSVPVRPYEGWRAAGDVRGQ